MERRFRRDSNLKKQYDDFMEEYARLGHMELIPPGEIAKSTHDCFYLAHHAVLKPESSTTKCRVVFHGSCKDASGISLNERLLIGMPIQRELFSVMLRFKVNPKHTDFQRIVWRATESSAIEHYRLLTVTYGLAPSPFLAVRVLQQLANDYSDDYPRASRVLLNDAYVHDIPTGCNTVQDLITLKNELIELLSKANFKLRKWSSNCWPLLETIPKEHCEFNPVDLDTHTSEASVKILGLEWNPCRDELFFKIQAQTVNQTPTKRVVLSDMSKIYDPLGIASPTVILFKILFQESWFTGLKWDDPLPPTLRQRWQTYMNELPLLSRLHVPRCISATGEAIELHGFADASSVACATVVFSRIRNGDTYVTNLVASKTRVAPLKLISIPRMELNAAVLLTRLISVIKASLTVEITTTRCCSDSEIVLHWLSSPPRKWNTFVCNRTAEILDTFPRNCWQHVRSADNPAYCASRGLLLSKLLEHELWSHGPKWISLPDSAWPTSPHSRVTSSDLIVTAEARLNRQVVLCATSDVNFFETLVNRSSSWSRLKRVIAFCWRFVQLCRRVVLEPKLSQLSLRTCELNHSQILLLQYAQQTSFTHDMQLLRESKRLPAKSMLIRYTPFIDEHGLLRVGGRIKHANVNYSVKHPILLPKDSRVAPLLIRYLHEKNLHTGVDATVVIIRQQFWIFGCRNLVRKVVFECKNCFLQRRTTCTQLMGDLPPPRIQPTRCFLHCGLDYAGPVTIKSSMGRNPRLNKAWFPIFICFSTKALHLEVVSDLTTNAFLAAFRRFIARRQAMVQGFWKRWHLEYLTSLQQRKKWIHQQPNIDNGSVVMIKKPNIPPSKWVLGRVVNVCRGDDNLVRVVEMKTSRGTFKRPITKIAPLPYC